MFHNFSEYFAPSRTYATRAFAAFLFQHVFVWTKSWRGTWIKTLPWDHIVSLLGDPNEYRVSNLLVSGSCLNYALVPMFKPFFGARHSREFIKAGMVKSAANLRGLRHYKVPQMLSSPNLPHCLHVLNHFPDAITNIKRRFCMGITHTFLHLLFCLLGKNVHYYYRFHRY